MTDSFALLDKETKRLQTAGKTELQLQRKVYDQVMKGAQASGRITYSDRGRPMLNGVEIVRK